jgi:hypothetical protein
MLEDIEGNPVECINRYGTSGLAVPEIKLISDYITWFRKNHGKEKGGQMLAIGLIAEFGIWVKYGDYRPLRDPRYRSSPRPFDHHF